MTWPWYAQLRWHHRPGITSWVMVVSVSLVLFCFYRDGEKVSDHAVILT